MDFHVVTRAAKADPATPEEAVDQTFHILSTIHKDADDTSPLQFISAEQLAYYRALEAATDADLPVQTRARYTGWMYSRIKRLRNRGDRKADRDISADPGTVGHMTVVVVEGVVVASIYAAGSTGRQDPLVPMLFRAKLITMHNDRMLLQGYERTGGQDDPASPMIKQEWAVQVMADQPHVPAPSERMG